MAVYAPVLTQIYNHHLTLKMSYEDNVTTAIHLTFILIPKSDDFCQHIQSQLRSTGAMLQVLPRRGKQRRIV